MAPSAASSRSRTSKAAQEQAVALKQAFVATEAFFKPHGKTDAIGWAQDARKIGRVDRAGRGGRQVGRGQGHVRQSRQDVPDLPHRVPGTLRRRIVPRQAGAGEAGSRWRLSGSSKFKFTVQNVPRDVDHEEDFAGRGSDGGRGRHVRGGAGAAAAGAGSAVDGWRRLRPEPLQLQGRAESRCRRPTPSGSRR